MMFLFLEEKSAIYFLKVLRNQSNHQDISKANMRGLTVPPDSSLRTCGFIPSGQLDLCVYTEFV